MKKFLIGLAVLLVLAIAGAAAFLSTLDVNNYRAQIADSMSKQTGRKVKLGGPIKLGFSWDGVTVTIQDASIGNPSWASHPTMAGIGKFDLGVALLPLLHRQFVVTSLAVAYADIDLETDRNGHHNWEMNPSDSASSPDTVKGTGGGPVAISVGKITISNSQLTMYDKDDQATVFKVTDMTLGTEGAGIALHFTGEYDKSPLTLSVQTGMHDIMSPGGEWPFDVNFSYANFVLKSKGTADLDKKQAVISSYEIAAGKSQMHGELAAGWGGTRSALQGTLLADHLDPADFKSSQAGATGASGENGSKETKRLFSDKPLGLDTLRSVDADINIKLGEITVGKGVLKDTTTRLIIRNGVLSAAPFETLLGDGAVKGEVKLDAAVSPAQAALVLNAPDIKLEDLLNFLGAPGFLSGKADANMNVASSGDSMHALASNAVGVVSVTAAGGNVSSSAASDIASGLMELFAPGGSNNLNCLAVRFVIKGGVAHDNGILADTSATTVMGNGGFDLGKETIDMVLHAKSKQVDVGGLMPPFNVSGTFLDPSFRIDPSETVMKVASLLSGTSASNNVPTVVAQQGQNACVYTLDHPSSATSAKTVMPGTLMGKVNSGIGNIGNTLRGILGQH